MLKIMEAVVFTLKIKQAAAPPIKAKRVAKDIYFKVKRTITNMAVAIIPALKSINQVAAKQTKKPLPPLNLYSAGYAWPIKAKKQE